MNTPTKVTMVAAVKTIPFSSHVQVDCMFGHTALPPPAPPCVDVTRQPVRGETASCSSPSEKHIKLSIRVTLVICSDFAHLEEQLRGVKPLSPDLDVELRSGLLGERYRDGVVDVRIAIEPENNE